MERVITGILMAVVAVLVAVLIRQRVRMRKLAEQAEAFLVNDGEPLSYSVQEDALAPLHNALAETQNRLLLAKERQQQECRRTSDLTADISHQLKTPLAALRLYCEMDESPHMEKQIEQISRMERLIYALMRLERLCADGYAFSFASHEVADIVNLAWSGLKENFPACTMELTGRAAFRCDDKWLGEAFSNLLKNACEHMPQGGVIRVTLETSEAVFLCTVEDEGGGASKADLPHLFERFYRAEGSKGLGIGLSIVREIIWRHHGTIQAENTARGLKMSINIPLLNLTRS